jgi:hypothetical protein
VSGIIRVVIIPATNSVFVKGPGLCITLKLNMATIAKNRY